MNYPFTPFENPDVGGMTRAELAAVADMAESAGWAAVLKFLGAVMEPVRPAVYANADPQKQLLLHQGLGAIYVSSSLTGFVSSARSKADALLQRERAASEPPEQSNPDDV